MQRITDRERQLVQEVLDGQFSSANNGLMVKRFEKQFAETFGVKYAIACANGTATLHTALSAMGIGSGDEVIVPPLTMASTTFAVIHTGATPVFADVDPNTFTIDPVDIQRKITRRTKAIIPVALYGLSPDMDSIMKIAKGHKLYVLEDDAQCFLGYYKGQLVGTIGDMASFSFQASKHMTSGEGGILITNNKDLAERARRFSSLGYITVGADSSQISKDAIQDPGYERHSVVGYNYRMSDLCAAVALGQMERLEKLVMQRVDVARLLHNALRECKWLIPQLVPGGYQHSYWTYAVRLRVPLPFSWYDFREKFKELGGDGIYAAWKLTYQEPALCNYAFNICPVATFLQPRLLQFKTNYFDMEQAEQQATVLANTIEYFNRRLEV